MNTFGWITLFALGAMVVNTLGIWAIYRHKSWAERNIQYFLCFAAGMLIASPLIMAFPEAIEANHDAGTAALAGFIFMFLSNRLIRHRTGQKELAFGITALQGIGLHSFIDGVIYSVTFSAGTITGILAGLGLVVHEFAEGVIAFSFLVRAGVKSSRAILYAFLVAALTTPVGAFVAYPLIRQLTPSLLGLALGFVAGVLIYVSAAHLLPEAGLHEKKHSYLAFLSGIVLALLLSLVHH